MRVARSQKNVETIPVDFLADPDGSWDYEAILERVGFDQRWGQLAIGALKEPYDGFPEGAAVVTLTSGEACAVALVDCTVPDESTVWS